jgi:DNA polymerase-1
MAEQKTRKLVLIDAHAILHRAYHALPQFSNSRGEPTGGLYGLAAMLIKIITNLRPDYIAAAYDLPKPTFRHEAYKDYKAGRAKADDALVAQMKRSREIFEAFNIPMYDREGYEADDILGTIVQQVVSDKGLRIKDCDVIIASGDMDTLQLVDDKRVQVFTLKKGINDTVMYDEEAVKARFGFGPELLPDFKGLKGDPSDNIKGIAGIGDKTATELITEFGSIENIYNQLKTKNSKLKTSTRPHVVELLEKGKEEAEFSKELATIRRDVPIKFRLPEKEWRESVDVEKAEKLFSELEFRQLTQRLKEAVRTFGESPTSTKSEILSSKQILHPHIQSKRKDENQAGPTQGSLTEALAATGIDPQELKETSVALWLINSNLTNPTLEDIFAFAQTKNFAAAREVIFRTIAERGLIKVFEDIERPLIPIVDRMNERGVRIDVPFLEALSKEYHKELSALEKSIHKLSTAEFNINSPKQLGEVLFNKMGLKPARQKKTAGGALSTRESELEKMREMHPIIGKILEYREFQKLLSTYIDNLPTMVAGDGRLHARFFSSGAATGRMASQNPGLQNIPIQTERGRRIRNAFIAEKGSALLALDYSQIELRVAAILSGDERLINIFKDGEDVHTSVAAYVFHVPRGEITKEMRRDAKVINFGILYGMGVTSLQQALKEGNPAVTRADAQNFLDDYFSNFHTLAEYIEGVKASAAAQGYTETLFGRRRSFEAIHSNIPYIRAAAERQAMNAPFQGTAADILKLAMIRVDEFLRKEKLEARVHLILSVHDELVYEMPEKLVKTLAPKIKAIMESVLPPKLSKGVPILAEAKVGQNWGEMKSLHG